MEGKLPTLKRSVSFRSPGKPRVSRIEDLPPLELLKSITPGHLSDLSSSAALENTPIALIPDNLGRAQTRVNHNKELRRLENIHKRREQRTDRMDSMSRGQSKLTLKTTDSGKGSPIRKRRGRVPSLSAKLLPSPYSASRSSSLLPKPPTFLSYLLDKSISFAADSPPLPRSIRSSIGLLPSPYRPSSKSPVKQPVDSPYAIISFSGHYHDGLPEGHGEAKYRCGDSYCGTWVRGKREGTGEYHYRRLELVYKGEWKGDLKHGIGVVCFSNGDKIELTWAEDGFLPCVGRVEYAAEGGEFTGELAGANRHGSGKMIYHGGAQYEGTWVNDCRQGLGTIKWHSGNVFQGSFEQDEPSAPGLLLTKNVLVVKYAPKSIDFGAMLGKLDDFPAFSSTCSLSPRDIVWKTLPLSEVDSCFPTKPPISSSGRFHSGYLTGFGLALYGAFAVYIGEFEGGRRHGYGRMTYTNAGPNCLQISETSGEYIGQWRKDQRHGWGLMRWSNGLVYEGQYRRDHRHMVSGVLRFPGGENYEGMWGMDLMNGSGKWTDSQGCVFLGKFVSGCPALEGTLELPDGGRYEGLVKSLHPHGTGRYQYPSGDVYVGDFVQGIRTGRGEMTYKDGSVYFGDWKEGLREGWGRFSTEIESYEGGWNRDQRSGVGVLRDSDGRTVFEGLWRDGVKEGRGVQGEAN